MHTGPCNKAVAEWCKVRMASLSTGCGCAGTKDKRRRDDDKADVLSCDDDGSDSLLRCNALACGDDAIADAG